MDHRSKVMRFSGAASRAVAYGSNRHGDKTLSTATFHPQQAPSASAPFRRRPVGSVRPTSTPPGVLCRAWVMVPHRMSSGAPLLPRVV